jgi:hypothetical protein
MCLTQISLCDERSCVEFLQARNERVMFENKWMNDLTMDLTSFEAKHTKSGCPDFTVFITYYQRVVREFFCI